MSPIWRSADSSQPVSAHSAASAGRSAGWRATMQVALLVQHLQRAAASASQNGQRRQQRAPHALPRPLRSDRRPLARRRPKSGRRAAASSAAARARWPPAPRAPIRAPRARLLARLRLGDLGATWRAHGAAPSAAARCRCRLQLGERRRRLERRRLAAVGGAAGRLRSMFGNGGSDGVRRNAQRRSACRPRLAARCGPGLVGDDADGERQRSRTAGRPRRSAGGAVGRRGSAIGGSSSGSSSTAGRRVDARHGPSIGGSARLSVSIGVRRVRIGGGTRAPASAASTGAGAASGASCRSTVASNTSLQRPQRTHPSEMRSWSRTTLKVVAQAGQRVTRLMRRRL